MVFSDANLKRIEEVRFQKASDGQCFSLRTFENVSAEECSKEKAANKKEMFTFDEGHPWIGMQWSQDEEGNINALGVIKLDNTKS